MQQRLLVINQPFNTIRHRCLDIMHGKSLRACELGSQRPEHLKAPTQSHSGRKACCVIQLLISNVGTVGRYENFGNIFMFIPPRPPNDLGLDTRAIPLCICCNWYLLYSIESSSVSVSLYSPASNGLTTCNTKG